MQTFESFRDPQGKVFFDEKNVWRVIASNEADSLNGFLALGSTARWQKKEKIIQTTAASQSERDSFVENLQPPSAEFNLYKHRRIEFPSFPYEWAPEMLYEAGKLTLELAEDFYDQSGWSLKDASPFNILFQATEPIFIDVLSFERRLETDPLWLPYNQFAESFLLPLLINKEIGLSLRTIFLANRDGLPVREAANLLGAIKKFKPGVLSLVTLPLLLSGRAEGSTELYKPQNLDSAEKAQFILKQSFKRLRRQLENLSPHSGERNSHWSEYTDFNRTTIPKYMRAKEAFVIEAVKELKPEKIFDAGCNDGFFTFAAARANTGASIVAADADEAVIGEVFRTARRENLNVLPLVVNLSRPSPRMGWRYLENPSFLDRAAGHFDLVMMLAIVHHLLVQERIPLREILRLAADLTRDALIVEFVPPQDELFRRLARGRDHLHRDLTTEHFVTTAQEFFRVERSEKLPQTEREIFLMRKK